MEIKNELDFNILVDQNNLFGLVDCFDESIYEFFNNEKIFIINFTQEPDLLDIYVFCGIFPSKSQARKCGINSDINEGVTYLENIGKFKKKITIYNLTNTLFQTWINYGLEDIKNVKTGELQKEELKCGFPPELLDGLVEKILKSENQILKFINKQ